LTRFERGDETVEAFCAREGVSKSTFNRWRSRGIAAHSPEATRPAQATMVPTSAGFVDLGSLRTPSNGAARLELTLDLGDGITLHVVRG
jgi:hypothetical protein